MASPSSNFAGLYNSNIEKRDIPVNSLEQSILLDAQQKNNQPKFGKVETMSFYNPLFQNQYKPRYEASWQYSNLGFNPHRDNETLYNEKMSGIDKFQRAAKQMAKVAGYSAIDQLSFGATSLMTANKFAEANAIGGSSEKGLYASALNMMINAGFTLGIGLEVALESILLETATLGGASLYTGAKVGRAASTIKRGLSMAEATRKQRLLATELEGMTKASKLSEFATKAAEFLNPLENTTSFIKDVRNAERVGMGMNKAEKIAKGTTALWHDVQMARGVYTESKLEGNFAQKDMEEQWMMDYQQKYGRPPSEEDAKKFHENAVAANFSTAMINMPLIYLTNKITLAPIFRPLEKTSAGQIFGEGARRAYFDISKSGLRTIKKLPEETLKRLGFLAKNSPKSLIKNTIKYSGENFMEGAQEVLQEITSGAAKEYYYDNFDNSLRGSWLDYMSKNAADQVSKKGLETFASGMLMQAFLSPVYRSVGGIMRGAKGDRTTLTGKLLDKVDYFAHRNEEGYKEKKADLRKKEQQKFDEDIENANFFFQNAANYFNGNYEQLAKSKKFSDLYAGKSWESLTEKEQQKYADDVHQLMNGYLVNAIQRGYYNTIVDQMNDMSKTLKNSRDELISDIGEEQAAILEKNIDSFISKAKSIKEDYDLISSTFKKPFSDEEMLSVLKTSKNGQAAFNNMMFANQAYDKAVTDYIFAKDSLKLGIEKQNDINKEITSVFNDSRSGMSWNSISLLYDRTSIQERLSNINGTLNGFNGDTGLLSTKESERTESIKQQINDLEVEKLNLEKVLQALDDYEKAGSENAKFKSKEQAFKNLKERMRSHISHMDHINNPNDELRTIKSGTYDKLSELIADYNIVSLENRINNQSIEFLTDPDIWQRNIDVIAKAAEEVYNQHEQEVENSVNTAREQKDSDDLIHELYSIGVTFENKDDHKEIRKSKKMPSRLVDADTKARITYLDEKYMQAVEIIKKHIPDLEDIPIPQKKEHGTQGLGINDSKTLDEFSSMGIEVGKTYSATDLLDKFIKDNNIPGEGNYRARRTLAVAFLGLSSVRDIKVKIVDNADTPVSFSKGNITLDLRYFSKEYKNHTDYSFALLKGVTGALTCEGIENTDSEFFKNISSLFEDAKKQWQEKKKQQETIDENNMFTYELNGFNSLQDFVIEALTNERFQIVLSDMKSNMKKASERNIFSTYVSYIKKFFKDLFKKADSETILNDTLYVITDFVSKDTAEATGNIQQETVQYGISDTSDANDLIVALTENEKEIITNTYLVSNGLERKNQSNDTIISSDDFMNWWLEKSFVVQSFINSHNASASNTDKNIDLSKLNLRSVATTNKDRQEYEQSGVASRARLAVIAQKLIEGHRNILTSPAELDYGSVLTDLETDIWNAVEDGQHKNRQRIREIHNQIIENAEHTTEEDIQRYINELVSLGYDEEELYNLKRRRGGEKRIANLAALAIPYNELQNISKVSQTVQDQAQSISDFILQDSLNNVHTRDELEDWKIRNLSILSKIPYEVMPNKISVYEIERMYQEKLASLDEPTSSVKVNDIIYYKGKPYTIIELYGSEVTLMDSEGTITIDIVDEQDNIEYDTDQTDDLETIPEENHETSIDESQLAPEDRDEIAEKLPKEEENIGQVVSPVNDKLVSLADKIIEDFKNCK